MKLISAIEYHSFKKLTIGKIIARFFIILGITICAILILGLSAMAVLINGPSDKAKNIFVTTCMETSFAKYFPPIYLSQAEIAKIMENNSVVATNAITDTDTTFEKSKDDEVTKKQPDTEIVDVKGPTFIGRMAIIKDPSKVSVVAPLHLGKDGDGEKLVDMINRTNAIIGINGGGFADEGGMGNGGTPLGVVVENGVFRYGEGGGTANVIGLDNKNVLHVGFMNSKQIKERKIRDAVTFGPPLIINSIPTKTIGNGGGLNPRTAIGQRKDGSILLLAIDGRQSHSLGASYKDLVDVMQQFGAVNAGNLDGGSSSMMIYHGKAQTESVSIYGPRKIASGFIVKP